MVMPNMKENSMTEGLPQPDWQSDDARIHLGDCLAVLRTLPDASVNCCVTSPPYYGLRDYGHDGQLGLEPTPDAYVANMVAVFREVRRVLADDGTLWLNIGDSYAANRGYQVPSTKGGPKHSDSQAAGGKASTVPNGLKQKDLMGIPWRVAFALQADGWYLRQDIIWHKPNPMPESVRDRCTKAHEYVFLLSKSAKYHYDADAVKEDSVPSSVAHGKKYGGVSSRKPPKGNYRGDGGYTGKHCGVAPGRETRNRRSVWTITPKPYKGAHFATMPPDLAELCILAGCPADGVVLDPFNGSGTTGAVAVKHKRKYVGIELNADYIQLSADRIQKAIAERGLYD
jgi:DNA modification methylase